MKDLTDEEQEHLVPVVAWLVVTNRTDEAAAILRHAPRLRRAVLRLARLLLNDLLRESEAE